MATGLQRTRNFTQEQTDQLHGALMEQVAPWDYSVIARVEGGLNDPLPHSRWGLASK